MPQWLFDRAICCGVRQAERPMVDCAALLRLKALLCAASAASDKMVIEAQHRSSNWKGDIDAKLTSRQSQLSAGSVSRAPEGRALPMEVREQTKLLLARLLRTNPVRESAVESQRAAADA